MTLDASTIIAGISLVMAMGAIFAMPWKMKRVEKDVESLSARLTEFEREQKSALVLLARIDTRMEAINQKLEEHGAALQELRER